MSAASEQVVPLLWFMVVLILGLAGSAQCSNETTPSSSSSTTSMATSSTTAASIIPNYNTKTDNAETETAQQNYDVIDVLAATSGVAGKAKQSGQTTRIYTTGEVNDDFWLKHLGEDFKHAIHLQVGGTNDEYNRLINQTQDGVHEEVHHEYLPGAERPDEPLNPYEQRTQQITLPLHDAAPTEYVQRSYEDQLNLDAAAYQPQQFSAHNTYTQSDTDTHKHYRTLTHNNDKHTHGYKNAPRYTYQEATHTHTRRHKTQQQQQNNISHKPAARVINSSEDTMPTASTATHNEATSVGDSYDSSSHSQLPFKSPFNDYGSRPTREVTHELYESGL